MLTTNSLVKGLLIVAYLALYGVLAFLFRDLVNDPLFHAVFAIFFIVFICVTYDVLYPYMLMGFKSSRGDLPASRLGALAVLINAMHEHADMDSLLYFAGSALTRLMNVEKTTILVCDTLVTAGAENRHAVRGVRQWKPGLLGLDHYEIDHSAYSTDPALLRLEETNPLLLHARSQRTVFLASHCSAAVARELQRFDAEQGLPAHGEQGLLCLLLPGGRLLQVGNRDDEAPLLHFFCRQLNIAVERIDAQRRQQARRAAEQLPG